MGRFPQWCRHWQFWGLTAIVLCGALGWLIYDRQHDPTRVTEPFRIGFENAPPHQFVGADGSPNGPAIDLMTEAAKSAHIPIVWVYAREGPDASLDEGKVDLWPLLGELPERKRFYISAPWLYNTFWIVGLEPSNISGPQDLVGRKLAFRERNIVARMARSRIPGAIFVGQEDEQEALTAMCRGQVDAVLLSVVRSDAKFFEIPECQGHRLRFVMLPHGDIMYGIGASRRRPQAPRAADILRARIGDMAHNGTLSTIFFRNFRGPANDAIFIYYLLEWQLMNRRLIWGVGILTGALLLLGWQTLRVRAARLRAEASEHAKGDFLANMSHEIRTPLNGMIGLTELALQTNLDLEQRDLLVTARCSADTLLTLINDILDLSKIEAGRLELEEIPVDLPQLIGSSLTAFSLRAQQKGLRLTAEITPDCPLMVLGDPVRLRQVLFNLLGNAIKFTSTGAVELRVAPEKGGTGKILRFSVSDTGVGISLEQQRNLFRPFSQADTSTTRKYGGTGLGLAISRRLVELMQGHIWIESQPGQGTTIQFTVPLAVPEAATADGGASSVALAASPALKSHASTMLVSERKLRILVAEDNPVNQKLVLKLLERQGHTVMIAENGKQALELCRAHAFDLMLMDVQMPDMDGLEATARIRAGEANGASRIPIVALTAHAMKGDAERCRAAGMDGYVTKPIDLIELNEVIAAVTRKSPANPN